MYKKVDNGVVNGQDATLLAKVLNLPQGKTGVDVCTKSEHDNEAWARLSLSDTAMEHLVSAKSALSNKSEEQNKSYNEK